MKKKYCFKIEVIYRPNNLVEKTYYVYAYSGNHARNIGNLNLKDYMQETQNIILKLANVNKPITALE